MFVFVGRHFIRAAGSSNLVVESNGKRLHSARDWLTKSATQLVYIFLKHYFCCLLPELTNEKKKKSNICRFSCPVWRHLNVLLPPVGCACSRPPEPCGRGRGVSWDGGVVGGSWGSPRPSPCPQEVGLHRNLAREVLLSASQRFRWSRGQRQIHLQEGVAAIWCFGCVNWMCSLMLR